MAYIRKQPRGRKTLKVPLSSASGPIEAKITPIDSPWLQLSLGDLIGNGLGGCKGHLGTLDLLSWQKMAKIWGKNSISRPLETAEVKYEARFELSALKYPLGWPQRRWPRRLPGSNGHFKFMKCQKNVKNWRKKSLKNGLQTTSEASMTVFESWDSKLSDGIGPVS